MFYRASFVSGVALYEEKKLSFSLFRMLSSYLVSSEFFARKNDQKEMSVTTIRSFRLVVGSPGMTDHCEKSED